MNKIKDFWLQSYKSDQIAFYCELISFVFTVGASAVLAFTADQPDMRYVYPGFFIGSATAVYGYWRRKLAWPMMLTSWFVFVNVIGFGVAMHWW